MLNNAKRGLPSRAVLAERNYKKLNLLYGICNKRKIIATGYVACGIYAFGSFRPTFLP